MINSQVLTLTDFYKTDHRSQYPDKTQMVYSNWTPRMSRISGVDSVVVFGLQYLIKEYLIKQFNDNFFNKPLEEVLTAYKRRLDNSLGKDSVDLSHITDLHKLGYLPIEIKSLPEGTVSPIGTPMITICNTDKNFYWITNFLETLISNILWLPMTSATTAYSFKKMLNKYAEKTSSSPEFACFQGHDFSMRGMAGIESAAMSGAGHLLSFKGTDSIPAIDFLETYYNANSDKELIGVSVPATEHSVMSMGRKESERETYIRLITDVYPTGIVSIVSDTWDYWKVLTDILPSIKEYIMNRAGKLVIRPDSGDPVKIIVGDENAAKGSPEFKGSVEVLYETLGGLVNDKGYKELDSHIGLIYGDSITFDRANEVCKKLEAKGFSSTNIVFGIGSYTYQYVTRDTFSFAIKSTAGIIDNKLVEIFKDPKTDSGFKKSAKGLLKVNKDLSFVDRVSLEDEKNSILETVFKNGKITKEVSLQEIRTRIGV